MPKVLVLPGLDQLGSVLHFSFGELGIDPEMLTEDLVGERDVTKHVKVVMPGDNLDGQCLRGTACDKRYQRKCRFAERPITVEESEFWLFMDEEDAPFAFQDPLDIAIAREEAQIRRKRRRSALKQPFEPQILCWRAAEA